MEEAGHHGGVPEQRSWSWIQIRSTEGIVTGEKDKENGAADTRLKSLNGELLLLKL